MRVNETPQTIREQNINLARLNQRRYFSLAKRRMHHGLAPAIGASSIVWSAYLGRSRARYAALVGNARAAYRATNARNSSLLADRSNDVPALFTALEAHLLDSISGGESWLLQGCNSLLFFHVAPSFDRVVS
jgi:hypothetical protein